MACFLSQLAGVERRLRVCFLRECLLSLPLPVQLDVEADSLASAFYQEGPLSTQNVIMTPSH